MLSSCRFVYISLNIDYLCQQPTIGHIRTELEKLKKAQTKDKPLDPTYDRIIETLRKHETCATLAFAVLTWIVRAHRPLTIHEFQIAVSLKPNKYKLEKEDIPDPATLIDICACLVVIDENSNAVRVAHFMVHEYILRKKIVAKEVHPYIAIACTTYLSFDVFKEGASGSKKAFKIRLASHHFLSYAAHSLSFHLKSCDKYLTTKFIWKFLRCASSIATYSEVVWSGFGAHRGGDQPLHIASHLGHEAVVRLLIEKGANVSATGEKG